MTHLARSITMKKIIILLFTLLLILTSCSQVELDNVVSSKTTASVKVIINNASSRTITPNRPNFNSFAIKIVEDGADNPKSTSKNVTIAEASQPIEFTEMKIGLHTVSVEAFDDKGTKVAYGEAKLNVQANSDNTVNVKLDYLTEGTGSFNVDISWNITSLDNPFGKALQSGSIGFVAYDVDEKKALNDAEITWLTSEQIQAKGFNYSQSGIPATKGKVISFRIYTLLDGEIQCIGETFTTVIQIIPNLISTPDLNEDENFIISDDRVNFYIKNVNPSTINVIYGEGEKAASEFTVTWKYPKLSNGNYSGKLEVYLMDNNGTKIGETKVFNYTQADSDGSATFTGLNTSNSYSVYFYNESETGYSAVLEGASGIKTKVLVTGINFTSTVPNKLTMGSYAEVLAQVLPTNATNNSYTLSASNGAYVSGNKTVVFPSSGRYTVTATSDDNSSVSITSGEIVVNLATPVVRTSIVDEGFLVEWNEIAGATKYILTKTSNDPSNSTQTTKELTTNSYTDIDQNYSGITYSYTVQAISADPELNSAVSNEASIALACPTITIELPNEFSEVALKEALNAAAGSNPHMTKSDSLSLNIESPVAGITEYAWYLNGSLLVRGDYDAVKQYVITPDNAYIDTSSVETSNTLMLTVVKDGYTYSATTFFKYIESDPGQIYISATSDTVVYNEPVTISYSFENSVNKTPEIEWTSSNTDVATVDSNGQVTALRDGNFEITATIKSTGKSATISNMKTFIPVSSISFNSIPSNYLIRQKTGVEVLQDKYKSVDLSKYVTVTAANGEKYSAENNLTWNISNSDIATVANGVVTPTNNGGSVTIYYYTDSKIKAEQVSGSITIDVRDYGIMYNGSDVAGNNSVKILGGVGGADYQLSLSINGNIPSSLTNESLKWGIKNDPNTTDDGLGLKLKNNTSITTTLHIGWNAYERVISAYIYDLNGTLVCKISFTRVS